MKTIFYLLLSFKQNKISVWGIIESTTLNYCVCSSHDFLELILNLFVESEDEGSTGSSDDVREATLEECGTSFLLEDLLSAINSTIIEFLITFLSGGHHKSSSDGIKWVGDDTSGDGNNLSESEEDHHVWLLTQHDFTSIEETEVRGSVENDTNNGDSETLIESTETILGHDLLEAINETVEFSLSFWA